VNNWKEHFFSTKNGFYEGRLKNYSNSGLFIETEDSLSVGDIIAVALPYVKGKQVKVRGEILRCDKKGFGIELFKKRSVTNEKILNKLWRREDTREILISCNSIRVHVLSTYPRKLNTTNT
jgi:hypothetical protein